MSANPDVQLSFQTNEPQFIAQLDRMLAKGEEFKRVFGSDVFKAFEKSWNESATRVTEHTEKTLRVSRQAVAEHVNHIAQQAKSLAELQKQYSGEAAKKIAADLDQIKVKQIELSAERNKALQEGKIADAQATRDKLANLAIESKSLNLILQQTKQAEREKADAAKARAAEERRVAREAEAEHRRIDREQRAAERQSTQERRAAKRQELQETKQAEREKRAEDKRTHAEALESIAKKAGIFRTYEEIEIASAKKKTNILVAEVESLQKIKKRAHDESKLAATEEARVEAKAQEQAAKEEIASLNLVLNKRKEVIHEGMGASIGKLGLFREFESKGVGGALMGGLAGAGALLSITSIASAATKLRETARVVDDAGDTLNVALTRSGKGAAYARAEQLRLVESSKMMADEFAMDRFEVNKLQAEIVGYSGITGPLLDKLTRISIGAAQQLQMAPEQIARLLARALNGDTEARLGRIAIHFDKNATAAEKLAIIEKKLGASVDATAKSTRDAYGDFDRLQHKVKEAAAEFAAKEFEKLGPVFRDLIPKVDTFFEVLGNVTTFVSRNIDVYAGFGVTLGGVAIGIRAITAAMAGNPILLAIGAAAALATAIAATRKNIYEAADQADRLNTNLAKLDETILKSDNIKSKTESVNSLIKRYEDLSTKANKTKKDQEELRDVSVELVEVSGGAVGKVDEFGNAEGITKGKIDDYTDSLRKQNEELRKNIQLQASQSFKTALEDRGKAVTEYYKLGAQVAEQAGKFGSAPNVGEALQQILEVGTGNFSANVYSNRLSELNDLTAAERAASEGADKLLTTSRVAVRKYISTFSDDERKNPVAIGKQLAAATGIDFDALQPEVLRAVRDINEAIAQAKGGGGGGGGDKKDPYEAEVERIRNAKDAELELYIDEGHKLEEVEARRRELELETDDAIYQAALKFGKNVGELHLKVINDRIAIDQADREAAQKLEQSRFTEQTNRLANSLSTRLHLLDESLAAGNISQRKYEDERHKQELSTYSAQLFYAEIFFGRQSNEYKSYYDKLEELDRKYSLQTIARRRDDDKIRIDLERKSADNRISLVQNSYERAFAAEQEAYRRTIEDLNKQESEDGKNHDADREQAKRDHLAKMRQIEEDSWKGTQDLISGIVQDGADGIMGEFTSRFFDPSIARLRSMPGFWQHAMAGVLTEVNKAFVQLATKAAGFAALKLFFPQSKAAEQSFGEYLGLSPHKAPDAEAGRKYNYPGAPLAPEHLKPIDEQIAGSRLPDSMDMLRASVDQLRVSLDRSGTGLTAPTGIAGKGPKFPNTGLPTLDSIGNQVIGGPDIPKFAADDPGLYNILTQVLGVQVPTYKTGTGKARTKQGIAYLHDGEAVLPKAHADLWEAIQNGGRQEMKRGSDLPGLGDSSDAMSGIDRAAEQNLNAKQEADEAAAEAEREHKEAVEAEREKWRKIKGSAKSTTSKGGYANMERLSSLAGMSTAGQVSFLANSTENLSDIKSAVDRSVTTPANLYAQLNATQQQAASVRGGVPLVPSLLGTAAAPIGFPLLNMAGKLESINNSAYQIGSAQTGIGALDAIYGGGEKSLFKGEAYKDELKEQTKEAVVEGFSEAAAGLALTTGPLNKLWHHVTHATGIDGFVEKTAEVATHHELGQQFSGVISTSSTSEEPGIGAARDAIVESSGAGSQPLGVPYSPEYIDKQNGKSAAGGESTLKAASGIVSLTKSIAGLAGVSDKAAKGTNKTADTLKGVLGIGAQVASLIPGGQLIGGLLGLAGGLFDDGGYTGRRRGIGRVAGLGRSSVAGVVHDDEYVAKSSAVHKYGIGFFESVNNGTYAPPVRTVYSAPSPVIQFDNSRVESHLAGLRQDIQNLNLKVNAQGLHVASVVGRSQAQEVML